MSHSRILFQFPVSHYCEKSRWHLGHKGLEFSERNLLPGPHRFFTRRYAGMNTLPVLRDGSDYTGDSSRIALYLEKHYPEAPLIPEVGQGRRHVQELEDQFDRIGIHVHRWQYGHLLDQPDAMEAMLAPFRGPALFKRILSRIARERVRNLYQVDPHNVAQSEKRLLDGMERVERLIQGDPERYLHGDGLTLADVTAAAMLAPVVRPPDSPWSLIPEAAMPRSMRRFTEKARARPAGQWVLARYARDRHPVVSQLEAA